MRLLLPSATPAVVQQRKHTWKSGAKALQFSLNTWAHKYTCQQQRRQQQQQRQEMQAATRKT
jgi:hypothetical protein